MLHCWPRPDGQYFNAHLILNTTRYRLQHTAFHCNTLQLTATHCNYSLSQYDTISFTCIYVCVCTNMYMDINVYIYIHIYTYMDINVYIYVYSYRL